MGYGVRQVPAVHVSRQVPHLGGTNLTNGLICWMAVYGTSRIRFLACSTTLR